MIPYIYGTTMSVATKRSRTSYLTRNGGLFRYLFTIVRYWVSGLEVITITIDRQTRRFGFATLSTLDRNFYVGFFVCCVV